VEADEGLRESPAEGYFDEDGNTKKVASG